MEIFIIILCSLIIILQLYQIYIIKTNNESSKSYALKKDKKFTPVNLIIIAFAVFILLFFIFYKGGIPISDTNNESFIVTCVSIIAICTTIMVGYQIFNSLEHRLTIKKLEHEYEKSIKQHNNHDSRLNKADADHSRMIANILYENNKPIWAIGWIANSMRTYGHWLRKGALKEEREELIKTKKLNTTILCDCIIKYRDFVKEEYNKSFNLEGAIEYIFNIDNPEKENKLIIRTFIDLIDAKLCQRIHKVAIFSDTEILNRLIDIFLVLVHKYLSSDEEQIKKIIENCRSYKDNQNDVEREIEKYQSSKTVCQLFENDFDNICGIYLYMKNDKNIIL